MAYSDSFPAIRPSFQFNADAGRLDPRISYTRSTTGTFFGKDKHLSSHNLAAHNNNLPSFSNERVDITAGQTSPSGASDAFKVAQKSGITNAGYVGLNPLSVVSGQRYVFSMYAKAGTNRNFVRIADSVSGSTGKNSYFNLSTGATGTVHADHNATITAVGSSGWYRVSIEFTPDANRTSYLLAYVTEVDNSATVTDDQGFIYLYGLQLEERDSGGPTVYNATSGQIHREYAPTLQTAAINAPRFEHSASDSASEAIGQSRGLLIEGQAQNLVPYSESLANWPLTRIGATNAAAIGPDGTLSAAHLIANGAGNSSHYIQQTFTTVASTTYTFSAFVKPAGHTVMKLSHFQSASPYTGTGDAVFTLTGAGSVTTTTGTATITALSDGWYRVTSTGSAASTTTIARLSIFNDLASAYFYADDFSGILCTGVQYEANSFASSYIKSDSGSATTRAADSASMDLTQAGFNGGPFTVVSETEGGRGNYPRAWAISDGTANNRLVVYRNSTTASGSTDWYSYAVSDGSAQVSSTITSSASAGKLAVSYGTNDVSTCASGGTVTTDTSAVVPSGITTLYIGDDSFVGLQLNGHYKRIAIYGEALSDTNLISLTK